MGTQELICRDIGGARRDRTADLLHAMQALSQLSYSPTERRTLRSVPSAVKSLMPRLERVFRQPELMRFNFATSQLRRAVKPRLNTLFHNTPEWEKVRDAKGKQFAARNASGRYNTTFKVARQASMFLLRLPATNTTRPAIVPN